MKIKQMINGPHKSQFLSCVIAYSLSPGSMSIVYFALTNIPVISFFCMIDFVRIFRRKFLQKVLCFLYDFQSFNLNIVQIDHIIILDICGHHRYLCLLPQLFSALTFTEVEIASYRFYPF